MVTIANVSRWRGPKRGLNGFRGAITISNNVAGRHFADVPRPEMPFVVVTLQYLEASSRYAPLRKLVRKRDLGGGAGTWGTPAVPADFKGAGEGSTQLF